MDEIKETNITETEAIGENPSLGDSQIGTLDFGFMNGDRGEAEVASPEEEKKPEAEAQKEPAPTPEAKPTPTEKPAEKPVEEVPPSPKEVKLDKGTLDEIKKAVAPVPPQKEDKPYTIEDLYKETQRPVVTDKLVAALDAASPAEKAAILQTLFDQAAKHAFLLSQLNQKQLEANFNKRLEDISQKIAPVLTRQQETEMKSLEDTFFAKNPELKPYYRIVNLAAQELKASPEAMKIQDLEVGMSLVAARAKEILAASGIDLSTANLSAPQGGSSPAKSSVPKPRGTLDGGRSQTQPGTTSGMNMDWMNDR